MTVAELKNWLDDFDDDAEVCIGMYQRCGSNFAMNINEVAEYEINPFYDDSCKMVVIVEGSQMGTVDFDSEDY